MSRRNEKQKAVPRKCRVGCPKIWATFYERDILYVQNTSNSRNCHQKLEKQDQNDINSRNEKTE